ncbi:MAG: tRNA uridine-5-carboxymethylaminomethyl(34) synthesis GTPase MnmE [Candidatus Krumholzibacteria bacterium]|nr:tRNA uridine-5-carboxymethylaminomethyl(34) synthesis GTPase MnmE [Candidatus Krumholzibacteria bacterium]
MDGETVVALATPPGESGIAVVRISGPRAVDIIEGMSPGASGWKSHETHLSRLESINGEILDEALAICMLAPNSYTGEDVVEISCHGSMHLTGAIIEDIILRGAEPAGQGEFTKRAYLNGRMDLIQAEAVADLISSETKLQSRVALAHLKGSLSRKVGEIEIGLLGQLALVEVSIDFSEEDIETWSAEKLTGISVETRGKIAGLLESEMVGRKLRQGIRITILGPRNAGKSSLYNALIGEERAIVSEIPGTTRDVLRERIHIGGLTYYLEDTAGIAETGCEIEARGISMGMEAARGADIVLFVLDGSHKARDEEEDELRNISVVDHIVVLNKSDLGLTESTSEVAERFGEADVIAVSATGGEGLTDLRNAIFGRTVGGDISRLGSERIALNARQSTALKDVSASLERMEKEIARKAGPEIVSMELREAIDACGKVTGRAVSQDLLETIFSRFCIGK